MKMGVPIDRLAIATHCERHRPGVAQRRLRDPAGQGLVEPVDGHRGSQHRRKAAVRDARARQRRGAPADGRPCRTHRMVSIIPTRRWHGSGRSSVQGACNEAGDGARDRRGAGETAELVDPHTAVGLRCRPLHMPREHADGRAGDGTSGEISDAVEPLAESAPRFPGVERSWRGRSASISCRRNSVPCKATRCSAREREPDRNSRLRNGLTVVTHAMPELETAALGIWVRAGRAQRTAELNGIAHSSSTWPSRAPAALARRHRRGDRGRRRQPQRLYRPREHRLLRAGAQG